MELDRFPVAKSKKSMLFRVIYIEGSKLGE